MKKLLLVLFGGCASLSGYASFANPDPNDPFALGPDQQYAGGGPLYLNSFDASVRLLNTNNAGSATLIGRRSNITIDGQKYHKLSFATADHVMTGKTLNKVGFEGTPFIDFSGGNPVEVNTGRFEAAVGAAANFTYTWSAGLRDMGYLGVTLKYSNLTAKQNQYLEQLSAVQIGVVADTYRGAARSYGYGQSGTYQYDIGFSNKLGFKLLPGANPFGTHRFVNHTIKRGGTKISGNYNYDQLSWDASAAVGEGQLAPGDSGGSFMINGKLAGVSTYVTETSSAILGEYYAFGTAGGAYRFSDADKTWLLGEAQKYQAVPEPMSLIALSVGVGALLRKRRKA